MRRSSPNLSRISRSSSLIRLRQTTSLFRISSKLGGYSAGDREGVAMRCASYQEDGYPAGRWRLPTKAEFEFIFSQVNRGNLATLYEGGRAYWCAHGIGTPITNTGEVDLDYVNKYTNGASVRCVYDDWYWGSEPALTSDADKKTFTWGDIKREDKNYAPSINY